MIDENAILDAIKLIFDKDGTLRNRLGIKEGQSKVNKGVGMPTYGAPFVQIVVLTNEINNVTTLSEMTFFVNVYNQDNMDGTVDRDKMETILQRGFDLLHNQQDSLDVDDHYIASMYIDGRNDVLPDLDKINTHFGGLRCRMFAIKTE